MCCSNNNDSWLPKGIFRVAGSGDRMQWKRRAIHQQSLSKIKHHIYRMRRLCVPTPSVCKLLPAQCLQNYHYPLKFKWQKPGAHGCCISVVHCCSWYLPSWLMLCQLQSTTPTHMCSLPQTANTEWVWSQTKERSIKSNFKAPSELFIDTSCSSSSVQQGNRVILSFRHVWKLRAI